MESRSGVAGGVEASLARGLQQTKDGMATKSAEGSGSHVLQPRKKARGVL